MAHEFNSLYIITFSNLVAACQTLLTDQNDGVKIVIRRFLSFVSTTAARNKRTTTIA